MGLYDRIIGTSEGVAKIPVHGFEATIGEFADGTLSGAQAQAAIVALSGAPLDAGEVAEVQALIATVNAEVGVDAKQRRVAKINRVLLLGEARAPGYATPAEVAAKLGV